MTVLAEAPAADAARHRHDPAWMRARRSLLAGSACAYLGMGLGSTVTTLYLTLVLGCTIGQVALYLSAAGVAAVFVSPAAGRLSDRIGPRPVYLGLLAVQSAGRCAIAVFHQRPALCAALAVTSAAFPATIGVRAALVGRLAGPERNALAALGRALSNLGFGVGAAAAASVLAIGTPSSYRTALAASAALSLVACVLTAWVPSAPGQAGPAADSMPVSRRRRTAALANPAFLLVTVTSGCLLMLYDDMLTFAMPLWVTHQTRAPAWICSAALTANTLAIAAFQIPTSKRIGGVRLAGRATLGAGLLMAGAAAAFAATDRLAPLPASIIVIVAALLLTGAEVFQTAGAIVLGYDLAPPDRQGDYQGVYAAGFALTACFSPLLLTAVLTHHAAGWCLLAAGLAATGCTVPRLARAAHDRGSVPATDSD